MIAIHQTRLMMLGAASRHVGGQRRPTSGESDHMVLFETPEQSSRCYAILLTRPETRDCVTQYRYCVALTKPNCANCGESVQYHCPNGQCLLASTMFAAMPLRVPRVRT